MKFGERTTQEELRMCEQERTYGISGRGARLQLFLMGEEMTDAQAIYTYTHCKTMFFPDWDEGSCKNYREHLVECILDGVTACQDETLLDLVRKILYKCNLENAAGEDNA